MKKLFTSKYELGLFVKVLSMVVVLISVTFSWFVFAKDAWVNPFDVSVVGVVNVTISGDGKDNWGNKVVISDENTKASLTEFSGNGEKLYIPVVDKINGKSIISKFYLPDYSDRVKDYIEFDTYIKANDAVKLFLDKESSILPLDENNPKDSIAGAIRVAFLVENQTPIIWAPNATYEYKNGIVNKNGTPESMYSYVYSESEDRFISKDSMVYIENPELKEAGVGDNKNFIWGDISKIEDYINVANPILKIGYLTQEEYIEKITIRVWVEGTDREAQASLIGGKIKLSLKFKSEAIGMEVLNDEK